ncbi:hypothetical protein D7Z54_03245 [Salibacterium salarium]|uniref:Uncharacterized protein n=1 Tax=Salibacterium salarium TaxID=284579 RepID=A0A3R9PBP0_9BACI|nr:hypothetical protein [Salibacterium salarium]RSL34866.1 hypothetical protein D7Z54_03245 [Salibacterium salarium]
MKKNYTSVLILLGGASILGGLALKNIFEYSSVVGFGLGTVFLLFSAFFAGKNLDNPQSQ